jgi:hypothetical protein
MKAEPTTRKEMSNEEAALKTVPEEEKQASTSTTLNAMVSPMSTSLPPSRVMEEEVNDRGKELAHNNQPGSSETSQRSTTGNPDGNMIKPRPPKENPPYFDTFDEMQDYLAKTRPQDRPKHIISFICSSLKDRPPLSETLQRLLTKVKEQGLAAGSKNVDIPAWYTLKMHLIEEAKKFDWAKDILAEMIASEDYGMKAMADHFPGTPSSDVSEPDVSGSHATSQKAPQKTAVLKEGEGPWKMMMKAFRNQLGASDEIEKGISGQPVKQQAKGRSENGAENVVPASHQPSEAVHLTVLPGDRLILPNMPPDADAVQGIITIARSWNDQFMELYSAEQKNSCHERDERFQSFKEGLLAQAQVQPKSNQAILNEMIKRMEMAMKNGESWSSFFGCDETLRVEVANGQITDFHLTKLPSGIEVPKPPDLGRLLDQVKTAFRAAFEAVPDNSKIPKLDALLHFRKSVEKLSSDMPLSFTSLLKANFDKVEAAARSALPPPVDLKWGDGPYSLMFRGLEYEFDATQPDIPPPLPSDQYDNQPEPSKSKKKRRGKKKKVHQDLAPENQDDGSATNFTSTSTVPESSSLLFQMGEAYTSFLDACEKSEEDHAEGGRHTWSLYYFLQFKQITLEEVANCGEETRRDTIDNLEKMEDCLRRNVAEPGLDWGPGMSLLIRSMSRNVLNESHGQPESEVGIPLVQVDGSKNKRKRQKKKNKNKGQNAVLKKDLPSSSDQVGPPSNALPATLSTFKDEKLDHGFNRDPGEHTCGNHWCNHSYSFQKALADTIAALLAENPLDLGIKSELHSEMSQIKRRVDILDSFAAEIEESEPVKPASSNEIAETNRIAALKKGGARKNSASKTKPVVAAKPPPTTSTASTKIRTHLSPEEFQKLYPNYYELERRIAENSGGPYFAFGRLDTPELKRAVAVHILSSPKYYTTFMDCREHLNYLVACGDTCAALHSIEVEDAAEVVGEVHQEMTALAKARLKAKHSEEERKNAPLTEKDIHDQKLAESAKKMREMEEKEKAIRAGRDAKGKGVQAAATNPPSDKNLSLDMMQTALNVLADGVKDGNKLSHDKFGPENPPTQEERRIIVQGLLEKPEMMASFVKNMNGIKEIQDNGDPKLKFFRDEARLLFETMKEFEPTAKPVDISATLSDAPPTTAQKARLTEVYKVLKEMDTKSLSSKIEGVEMNEEEFLRLLSSLSASSLNDPLWAKVAPLVQKYILTSNNRKHLARSYASDPSRLAGFLASKLQIEELAKTSESAEIQCMADEAATMWKDVLNEQAKMVGKPASIASQDKPVPSVVEADTLKHFAATVLQDLVAAYSKASNDKERHELAVKYIMAHPNLPKTQMEASAFSHGAKHAQFMSYLAFLKLTNNIPDLSSDGESGGVSMLQRFKKEVEFVQAAFHELTAVEASQSKLTASSSKPLATTAPVSQAPETSQTITQYPFRTWEYLHDKLSSTDEERKEANRRNNVPQRCTPSEFREVAAFLLENPVILANFKNRNRRAEALPESLGDPEVRKSQISVCNLIESAVEVERLSPRQHDHVGSSKSAGATSASVKTFTSDTLAMYEAEYARASTDADRQAVNAKFGLTITSTPNGIRSAATQMLHDPAKVSGLAGIKKKLYNNIETGSDLERSVPLLGRVLMVEVAFSELTARSMYNDSRSNKPPAPTSKPAPSSPLSRLVAYEAAYNGASADHELDAINEKFNLPDGCCPKKIRDFLPNLLAQDVHPMAFYSIKAETEEKLEAGDDVGYNQKLLNRIEMSDAAFRDMCPAYYKKIASSVSVIPLIPSIERYETVFSTADTDHYKRAVNGMFMVPKDFSPEQAREIAATDLMNRDKLSSFFNSKSLLEHYVEIDQDIPKNQLLLNRSILIEEAWRELMTGTPEYPCFDDGKPWIADQVKSNIDKFLVEDSFTDEELLIQAKATLETDGDLLLFDDHKNYIAACAPHYPPAKKMLNELDRLEAIMQTLQAEELSNARSIAKSKVLATPTATPGYEYTPEDLATRRKGLADGFRRTQKSSLQPYEARDKAKYLLSKPTLMALFMEQRDVMERGDHTNDSVNEKFMLKEMRKVYAEIEKMQATKSGQVGFSEIAPAPPAAVAETVPSVISLKDTEFPIALGRAHAKAVLMAVPNCTTSVASKSSTRPRSNAISKAATPRMPVLKRNPAITVTSAPEHSIPVNRVIAFSDPNLKISPDPSFQPKTPQLPQDIEEATKAVTNAPVMAQKRVLAGLYAKSPKDYSAFKALKSRFEESVKERPEHWNINDDLQASKGLAMVKEVDGMVKELRMGAASEQRETEKELIASAAAYAMVHFQQHEKHKAQIERVQSKLADLMEVEVKEPVFVPSKFVDEVVPEDDEKEEPISSDNFNAKMLKAFKAGQRIRKIQGKKSKSPAGDATTQAERSVAFCGDVFAEISQTQMPAFTDPFQVVRFAMGKDPFALSSPNATVVPPKAEFNGDDTSSDNAGGGPVITLEKASPGSGAAPSTQDQTSEDQIPRLSTPSSAISYVKEALDSKSVPGASSASTQDIPGLNLTATEGKLASDNTSSSKVAPSTITTTPQAAPSISQARVDDFLNGKYTFPVGITPDVLARNIAINDIQRSILSGSALSSIPADVVSKPHKLSGTTKARHRYSDIQLPPPPPMELLRNGQISLSPGLTPPAEEALAAMDEIRSANRVFVQANPHLYPNEFFGSQAAYPAAEPRGIELCPMTGFPLPPPAPDVPVVAVAKEKEKKDKKERKKARTDAQPKDEEEKDALKESLRVPVTHEPLFCSVDLAAAVSRQVDEIYDEYNTQEMVDSYRIAFKLPAAPGMVESPVVVKEAEVFNSLDRLGNVYSTIRQMEEERLDKLLSDARQLQWDLAKAVDEARSRNAELEGLLKQSEERVLPQGFDEIMAVLDRGELGELDALLGDSEGMAGERAVMPLAMQRAAKRMRERGERERGEMDAEMKRIMAEKKSVLPE